MTQTGDDATIIQAVEKIGNDAIVLGSIPVTGKGTYRISFQPTGSSVQLWVLGAYDMQLKPTCYTYPVTTQETYLVDICDENKDRYRFGFNGQEKVNELAGIGNHNTALFWEYDTRTGRRWNLDPKPHLGVSDYSTFGNKPIVNIDVDGDYFTEAKGSNNLEKLQSLKKEVNRRIESYKKEKETANSSRQKELDYLINATQGWMTQINEMENSDVEFHLAGSQATKWDPENHRVIVGTGNGPTDFGTMSHEMYHGYQFLEGKLTGYDGASSDPLYDLYDEIEARMVGTLMGNENDLRNWHFSGKFPKGFLDIESTKQGSYPRIGDQTTQLTVKTSAKVFLEMKNNDVLSNSARQVLRTNPNATVGDAIEYYNNFKEARGNKERILTGKALENRR